MFGANIFHFYFKHKDTSKFTYFCISDYFHNIPECFLCANLVNYTIYNVTEREAAAF